jgi:hypothetical protein
MFISRGYHPAPLKRAKGAVKRNDPPHFAVALWSNKDGIPMTMPEQRKNIYQQDFF